jgi:hypothetical protein
LATSPTLVTPILGTPASGSLVNCTDTNYTGFKNRILNGSMVLDQRNAGASVTQTTSSPYTVDRFYCFGSITSKFTVQQNAASVTPPAGFINYLGATSSSAYTVGAAEQFNIGQAIEGLNIADLAWGTASAATVTLSFWVRSSLTGTFGGALRNSATDYSYPFSYTISVANTWEQKTITITGPTSGTWLTTNGVGIYLTFSMGAGATRSGTAGSWSANNYTSATGAVSVVGTNGATWYITGVQLEKGSTATSFDYRPFGTELALCQRYFSTTYNTGVAVGAASSPGAAFHVMDAAMSYGSLYWALPVKMRATPTTVSYSTNSGASGKFFTNSGAGDIAAGAGGFDGMSGVTFNVSNVNVTASSYIVAQFTASAEL